MSTVNVDEIATELAQQATKGDSGRAARTLYGGHDKTLRQTIITLRAGHELREHESPGEATLLVLQGEIRIGAGTEILEGRKGDLITIPPARHNLAAVTDAVVILSVAVAIT